MFNTAPLSVAPRYTRAVQIDRDFAQPKQSLDGYQVTPLVVQTLSRILAGLDTDATQRAFSLVGPFGVGKSAFGLFLAEYLHASARARKALLRRLTASPELTAALPMAPPVLAPVLIPGNNASLRHEVLRALHTTLLRYGPAGGATNELLALVDAAAADDAIDPQQVAHVVERTAALFAEQSTYGGVVVIIDELGQYLDFAAQHDDERELFVLQSLAEMAARSGAAPCLVVTILHQAFAHYTRGAGATRRIEWAKVQGRFVDLAFQEPMSQTIQMIAHALCPTADDPYATIRQDWAAQTAPAADKLGLRPAAIPPDVWKTLIAQAYPLHPTVLVALPYLFRQLAQNERSLFAFLHTDEPWGLRDVVAGRQAGVDTLPIYRLTHLFGYVETALGPSLFARARGQRWAELVEARALFGSEEPLLLDVLTVVGTIGALERSSGLRASCEHSAFALHDDRNDARVEQALSVLQERRVVTYRQHRDSYMLWEGSDLDLDAITQEARRSIAASAGLPTLLQRYADTTPRIARRHSYRTGATRIFAVRYVDVSQLDALAPHPEDADGELLYLVLADAEEGVAAQAWARDRARVNEPHRVVVVPHRVRELQRVLLDVAALQSILDERPELETDRVARREVAGRLIEAQQVLSAVLTDTYERDRSAWFHCGAAVSVQTAQAIDALLSAASDATYPNTPHVWNELIVRRQISSAATKARRNLVEALLTHAHEPQLGIVGYPPERAIYESVFSAGKLHRQNAAGVWHVASPPPDDPLGFGPVWEAMEQFLDALDDEPRPLTDLFALLEHAPYGVKSGLVPLLFVALYVGRAGEIVFYERGSYIPVPDLAMFERLLSKPTHFALRQSRADGARRSVYERLANGLAPRALEQPAQPALLTVAFPLLRLLRSLPTFSLHTKRIDPQAQAIRTALREARAPDELLFERLPIACGFTVFDSDAPADPQRTDTFIAMLRTGLEVLQAAYPQLIEHLAARTRAAFHTTATEHDAVRVELYDRFNAIVDVTNDPSIRTLGVRLEAANDSGGAWIESVAALVVKRSPELWNDDDIVTFNTGIVDLGRRFQAAEELAITAQVVAAETSVLRVGLTNGRGEVSRVLRLASNDAALQGLRADLTAALRRHETLSDDQRAMALATLLEDLLKQEQHKE